MPISASTSELTEVDLPIALFSAAPDPLAAQGDAYAEIVRACLAVSRCTGITLWGLEDGDTWLDHALIWSGLAPKPACFAVRDMLLAVPEPGSLLLTRLGLLAIALSRPCRGGGRDRVASARGGCDLA